MRILVLAVVLALAACGGARSGSPTSPPDEPPAFEGTVREVTPSEVRTTDCRDYSTLPPDAPVSSTDPPACTGPTPDSRGSIAVEVPEGSGRLTGPVVVHVPAEAPIVDEDGDTIGFSDLRAGDTLRVWTTGVVMESYPPQVTATFLERTG